MNLPDEEKVKARIIDLLVLYKKISNFHPNKGLTNLKSIYHESNW